LSLIKKAKDLNGFEYSIKVPQPVTRKALVDEDPERAASWAASFENTCVKPLAGGSLLWHFFPAWT